MAVQTLQLETEQDKKKNKEKDKERNRKRNRNRNRRMMSTAQKLATTRRRKTKQCITIKFRIINITGINTGTSRGIEFIGDRQAKIIWM